MCIHSFESPETLSIDRSDMSLVLSKILCIISNLKGAHSLFMTYSIFRVYLHLGQHNV